jgi:hypothetical protein
MGNQRRCLSEFHGDLEVGGPMGLTGRPPQRGLVAGPFACAAFRALSTVRPPALILHCGYRGDCQLMQRADRR